MGLREAYRTAAASGPARAYGTIWQGLWIYVLVVGGIGAAIAVGWDLIDLKLHYRLVDATVTAITAPCTLERQRASRTMTSDPMDCAAAAALLAEPRWQGYELIHHDRAEYRYLSPADGRPHAGAFDMDAGEARSLRVGSVVRVFAHRTEPGVSRHRGG